MPELKPLDILEVQPDRDLVLSDQIAHLKRITPVIDNTAIVNYCTQRRLSHAMYTDIYRALIK